MRVPCGLLGLAAVFLEASAADGFAVSTPVESFPWWTTAPFPVLVLAIAVLPIVIPHWWERRWFQILVSSSCAIPVVAYSLANQQGGHLAHAIASYGSFVLTLTALYVTSGGIHLTGDIEATPKVNVGFLLVGSLLASIVGTTGASMLLIRPLLRTNRQREHRAHLVPFFILAVANAGGLLTPLGDPPLLVGYIHGVPFFWTLRLFPIWVLYIATFAIALYFAELRAYAREPASAGPRATAATRHRLEANHGRAVRSAFDDVVVRGFPTATTTGRELEQVAVQLQHDVGRQSDVLGMAVNRAQDLAVARDLLLRAIRWRGVVRDEVSDALQRRDDSLDAVR